MDVHRRQRQKAAQRSLLNEQQAKQLWQLLSEQAQDMPGFRITHVLHSLGGRIAIGAMLSSRVFAIMGCLLPVPQRQSVERRQ